MKEYLIALVVVVSCGKGQRASDAAPGSTSTPTDGGATQGALTWVAYTSLGGLTIDALYHHPGDGGLRPAAVYIPGKEVVDMGYAGAVAAGYDVADFVNALADAGYVGISPIRPDPLALNAWSDYYDIILRAVSFVKSQPGVDPNRVYMIGFSQGGQLTLGTMLQDDSALRAVVFMSPAPGVSPNSWSEMVTTPNISLIDAKVFVTLGANEPNPDIVNNVYKFVDMLDAGKKQIESKLNYPGDHKWFHKVRPEYWPDIMNYLNTH